jgi:hypothetical protein
MPKELRYLQDPPLPKTIKTAFFNQEEFLIYRNEDTDIQLFLVQANENGGYSAGNNIALKFALNNDFDYVWILNNDTVVERQSLSELINKAAHYEQNGKKVGMIGSKVMFYYLPQKMQTAGGDRYYPILSHQLGGIGNLQEDIGIFDREIDLSYVSGCSIFLRMDFLKDVGFLEERFFLYLEEADWAIRARKKGWQLGYAWKAKIYHKEGGSTGSSFLKEKRSAFSEFYFHRAKLLLTIKHYPYYLPIVYIIFFLKFWIRIFKGDWEVSKSIIKMMLNPKIKLEENEVQNLSRRK